MVVELSGGSDCRYVRLGARFRVQDANAAVAALSQLQFEARLQPLCPHPAAPRHR